jgi:hypothetical protein
VDARAHSYHDLFDFRQRKGRDLEYAPDQNRQLNLGVYFALPYYRHHGKSQSEEFSFGENKKVKFSRTVELFYLSLNPDLPLPLPIQSRAAPRHL